jgi:DNA-binding transcriptional LysR family regulator
MLSAVTLDQLRVLMAVAEEGSFSAAGRRLGRVQSAISQSVQALETALGVQLFDRALKTPVLTEVGRALLGQARQVVLEAAELQAQATAIGAGMEPELTLAVDNLFPSPPLIASLRALRLQFPDLPVTLHTAPILAAERLLREGKAHFALCGLRPGDSTDLVAEPLTMIEMTPTAAADHPLVLHGAPLSRERLGRHVQLILTDPLAPPDAPTFGVISSRVWRFVDLSRRLDFLRAGFGWANMPSHLVASDINNGELTRLELAEPGLLPRRIPIFAIHARHRPPGPAGRWFLDQLQAACRA